MFPVKNSPISGLNGKVGINYFCSHTNLTIFTYDLFLEQKSFLIKEFITVLVLELKEHFRNCQLILTANIKAIGHQIDQALTIGWILRLDDLDGAYRRAIRP